MRTFCVGLLIAGASAFSTVVTPLFPKAGPQMAVGLMAEKVGMTQIFNEEGNEAIPVTVLKVGKNVVTAVKTEETCGYSAVQIGYDECAERKLKKPQKDELAKNGLPPLRHRVEFRADDVSEFTVGQEIAMDVFASGEKVSATGISSGKGFQGTIKRWHFTRGPMSHGSKNHRAPGSIGMGTDPGRILPGKHMAGQMGNKQNTIKGLEIVKLMPEEGIMVVKGAVPGKKGATVRLSKSKW